MAGTLVKVVRASCRDSRASQRRKCDPVCVPYEQEQHTCITGRLYPSVSVAPGGIGNGAALVVVGGLGSFGSGIAGEVSLWNLVNGTWTRLAVSVWRWDVAVMLSYQ